MTATPGPWRVVVVDVDGPVPIIDDARADGGRYERALVYLTRGGALVGEVEVALAGPVDLTEIVAGLSLPAGGLPVSDRDLPFASVVVATTMAREGELRRCLHALLHLDHPAYEVILVDNRPSSSPQRVRLHDDLSRDPRVRIVGEERPGISAARNRGARVARGEVVAFTDDDVVVDPGWLRAAAGRLAHEPSTGCVTGPVLPAELETAAQIWFERSGSKLRNRTETTTFRGPERPHGLGRSSFQVQVLVAGRPSRREFVYGAGSFGMGANLTWRREVFEKLGGYNEALGTGTPAAGGEDIDSLLRLLRRGGQITFDTGAIVHHYHRRDTPAARKQMYDYGLGATAVATSWLMGDPRHVVGYAYLLVPALRVLAARTGSRRSGGYPPELAALEARGMRAGPLAYLRSRRVARRSRGRRDADRPREAAAS